MTENRTLTKALAAIAALVLSPLAVSAQSDFSSRPGEVAWSQPAAPAVDGNYGPVYQPECYGNPAASCGDSCCNSCCQSCCCGPLWTGRIGAVFLRRVSPASLVFATAADGGTAFNYNQFNFQYDPGIEGSLSRDLGCGRAVEIRYLGLWDVSSRATVGPLPPSPPNGFYNTTPPTPGFYPSAAVLNARYECEIHSGEINYRAEAMPCVTLLGGFRYVNLRERFDSRTNFVDGASVDFATRVYNHLYGFQVGADSDLFVDRSGRFRISGVIKSGVYLNHADHAVSIVADPGPAAAFGPANNRGFADVDNAALVAEAGLFASHHLRENISLRFGYQVLYMSGVALAAEQITSTGDVFATPPVIPTNINANGNTLYHGFNAQVEVRY